MLAWVGQLPRPISWFNVSRPHINSSFLKVGETVLKLVWYGTDENKENGI